MLNKDPTCKAESLATSSFKAYRMKYLRKDLKVLLGTLK
jgi:hypothetical protein